MNEKYMKMAVEEAKKAAKKCEVPVGAVLVLNNKVIAKAHNTRQHKHRVIDHAEVIAIIKASKRLRDWRLNGCDLYVTLKPCSMCEAVIKESRIDNVYYILDKSSSKKEYYKSNFVQTNVCCEYNQSLSDFFENKR